MTQRTPTAMDALADKHFVAEVKLSPITMTYLGLHTGQDSYDDFSPAGCDAHHALAAATLAQLDTTPVTDDTDRVTASALRERLTLAVEEHQVGADLMDIANIDSGLHSIREVYDLMPTATEDDWKTIARRLSAVPSAIAGWLEAQMAGIEHGIKPALRQVDALIAQCEGWARRGGSLDQLLAQARADCPELSSRTRDRLVEGVAIAQAGYATAIEALTEDIRELATDQDAVGETRYALASREFLGTELDFEQSYRWGLEQVEALEERQTEICAKLRPGLSVADTKKALDHDPAYILDGPDAMKQWMQARAEAAIEAVNGPHFDIPEPARRIECMIAPTHDGGIYYTEPSDDFSRPGRMWWSVPEEQTAFSTWRELTTVHHEGVPGHHLQIGQAVYNKDMLNKWRRHGIWVSGHGEGWALYAEQLMADLGYLEDPAMMLGMLDGQALRAVRV
ncbi:MAG: DUF885 domain-containing protein, partial [Propionibacteriaceae bacterium]|nr:DUF885 domain-containing protein [Propionibacteriaceae bacterium]